ncbi:MAG: DNA-binding protein [Clostridiales bacterium]|nr:DNA-binding protein [Clostridiales bacterium]MCF8023704.1 DNA-binding protein [Clostridiales bacterium]
MKYTQGNIGRVFIVKIEHHDDLWEELEKLSKTENIETGIMYIIGALKESSMVTGPEECSCPPVPVWRDFDDCREVLGIGTIFSENGKPVFHLHGTAGKRDETLMGCIRGKTEIYLVLEVVVFELTGTNAFKEFNQELGVKMLNIT